MRDLQASAVLAVSLLLGPACLPEPDGAGIVDDTGGAGVGGEGSGDDGSGDDSGEEVVDGILIEGTLVHPSQSHMLTTELVVGLVQIELDDGEQVITETLDLTETLELSPDGVDWTLTLPAELDESWLRTTGSGPQVAEFFLAAWSDSDGDGRNEVTEIQAGAALATFFYISGEPDENWQREGFAEGWNRASRDFLSNQFPGEAVPITTDTVQQELPTNLFPIIPPTFEGTCTSGVNVSVSMVGYVGYCSSDRETDTYLYTSGSTGEFAIDLENAPPDGRWETNDLLDNCGATGVPPMGVRGTIFEVVAFLDVDGGGVYYDGALEYGSSTDGGEVTGSVLLYLAATSPFAVTYLSPERGGNMGWSRLAIGGLGVADFLPWTGLEL